MNKTGQAGVYGLIGFVVTIVAIFVAMRVGVFTDATVADAIPTSSLSADQNTTLEELEDNQQKSYKIVGIIPIIAAVILILGLIMRMARG